MHRSNAACHVVGWILSCPKRYSSCMQVCYKGGYSLSYCYSCKLSPDRDSILWHTCPAHQPMNWSALFCYKFRLHITALTKICSTRSWCSRRVDFVNSALNSPFCLFRSEHHVWRDFLFILSDLRTYLLFISNLFWITNRKEYYEMITNKCVSNLFCC